MRALALAIALGAAAVAHADSTVREQSGGSGCGKMPPSWKLEAITAAAAPGEDARALTTRVLAWQIDEDDRPLRVERALVWIAARDKRWILANLYRHPKESPEWHISRVYDVPYVGSQSYSAAPKRAQLDEFLKDSWWHFRLDSGWRSLGNEVCRDAWMRSFGEAPWRSYSK